VKVNVIPDEGSHKEEIVAIAFLVSVLNLTSDILGCFNKILCKEFVLSEFIVGALVNQNLE
jgi:hypothetical protein